MPALAPRAPAAPAAAPPTRRNHNESARPGSAGPGASRPGAAGLGSSRLGSAGPGPKPAPPARRKPRAPRKDAEHEILFQKYFKSVNPQRTYASQVKKAGNGNQYVVITEGKRDDATGEVRKTRVFVYSEDFIPFFQMLQDTAHFLRDNPVPEEVRQKRHQFWTRREDPSKTSPRAGKPPAAARPAAGPAAGPAPGPASNRLPKPVDARPQPTPTPPPKSLAR